MAAVIPVEFIFNPNWWHRHYSISFDRSFYLDPATRIRNDEAMRKALHERFGFGVPDPAPRPVLGSEHVAGGFIVPALLGAEVRFSDGAPPYVVPANLGDDAVRALSVPDLTSTWPMREVLVQAEALRKEFGYVVGDLNTDGVLNSAMHLRGERLFLDLHDDAELVEHLCRVVSETTVAVSAALRELTGTCSVAVNRSIVNVDPAIFLHANCTLQMISAATYERFLLPWELFLAERLQPYGIHHCGSKMQMFAPLYARVPARFHDVGWGSDVAACRRALPGRFLNLRLSPMRMLEKSAAEVREDARSLLGAVDGTADIGLCCINMDYGTPDENIRAVLEVAAENGSDEAARGSRETAAAAAAQGGGGGGPA